jgi:hypothetical protein
MAGFADAIRWKLLPYVYGEGLDLGCGDARPHDWMFGIDIKGGSSAKGPNRCLDATKLVGYFAPESQNFIFSSHLLPELQDWQRVLMDWWSLIKPMGYLILYGPIAKDSGDDRKVVACMEALRPWKFCEAQTNGDKYYFVFRKGDMSPALPPPTPEKLCVVIKLGAHGDALWASSVMPHLKEQGFTTWLYCQETTEEVLRHDPHIDRIIKFESRVPMGELGELFGWVESEYKNTRILVECVEGTLLPSPQKIQYHFPKPLRDKVMNFNYLEMHHAVAKVPMEPRMKFYPTDEEKRIANDFRSRLRQYVVVLVAAGSSLTKNWPYNADLVRRLMVRDDVSIVVLGDQRGMEAIDAPNVHNIFTSWPIRQALTFAQLANVVVGQETGLTNCVGFEPSVRKVMLLSHSGRDQLTKGWPNTATIVGEVPCWPCHRLHYDWSNCNRNQITQLAECQTAIRVGDVLREVEIGIPYIEPLHVKQARMIQELEARVAAYEGNGMVLDIKPEDVVIEDGAAKYSAPSESYDYSEPTGTLTVSENPVVEQPVTEGA